MNPVKLAWNDYHLFTVKHNKKFRKYMFRRFFIFWWFFPTRSKRNYAKQWNHARNYGAYSIALPVRSVK